MLTAVLPPTIKESGSSRSARVYGATGMMRVVHHRLAGVNFRAAQCSGGTLRVPTLICAHDTAGSLKPFSSVQWFENPACETSAHVVIERDGTVTQMVPFDIVAFHAGRSSWKGKSGVNAFGIGIEIVNPGMMVRRGDEAMLVYKSTNKDGHIVEKIVERFPIADCVEVETPEHGAGWCLPYTPEQTDAFLDLCSALARAYPTIGEIVTHWLISPGRKVDTCPLFPLEEMRAQVFGGADPAADDAVARPPGPRVAAPTAPKPGLFDGLSFAKLNELADGGSRIAAKIQQFKRWLWGGSAGATIAAASVDTSKGSGAVITAWVAAHPLLTMAIVAAVGGAVFWGALKIIEKYLVTAANSGRYTPRGGPQ